MNGPRRALLGVLADGAVHSGARLGHALGMSRAAVGKHVARLREAGWPIHARRGSGYVLAPGRAPFDRAALERALAAAAPGGATLELLDQVDSTSAHLAARTAPPVGSARVCVAEVQTAGRGRRGRAWTARPGSAIAFTVDRLLERSPAEFGPLALAVGVAAAETLARHGVAGIGVKWPNDLVYAGAKLGGILVEIRGQAADRSRALVGVGVNHGPHVAAGIETTSVDQVAGADSPDRSVLAGALAGAAVNAIEAFESDGAAVLQGRWTRHDVLAGQPIRASAPGGPVDGIARGVRADGALCVAGFDGREHYLHSAEVSVRRQA